MLYPVMKEYLDAVAEREIVDPETGELVNFDDEGLAQRIRELHMSVEDEVLNAAGYIKTKEAEMEILSDRIAELSDLKKRLSRKNDILRQRMLIAMQAAGIEKVESLELAVRTGRVQSLEVDENFEKVLPRAYLRVVVEPDKVALKKAIKDGEAFSCARQVARDNVVIRVR